MYYELLAHLIGDYVLQSGWMGLNKNKQSFPAFVHALFYTLPFCFLSTNVYALIIISGTHFLIDRFSLAKYVCMARNYICPIRLWSSVNEIEVPIWLGFWLNIIVDNTLHLVINALVLYIFS